jgi:hypothetical protein
LPDSVYKIEPNLLFFGGFGLVSFEKKVWKLCLAVHWCFFQMGCPALAIWVGFLKQPALPGEATPPKNSSKIIQKNKNH